MDNFPELHDLIGFFEVEPVIEDRDVPWFYSKLVFRTIREHNKIYFAIEPGHGKVVFIWESSNDLIASLNLENVTALLLFTGSGTEKLLVKFAPSANQLDFELQLKPTIHIKWGNERAL